MSEIERYLDELFDRLAGLGAAGRRALAEVEDHLRAAAADAVAGGLPADQAEVEAVARFGSPAVVARTMRSAVGGGRASRAAPVAWLLAALAAAGLTVACLAASGWLGWQPSARICGHSVSPSCPAIVGTPVRGTLPGNLEVSVIMPEIAPDGKTAYVATPLSNTVTPIPAAANTPGR